MLCSSSLQIKTLKIYSDYNLMFKNLSQADFPLSHMQMCSHKFFKQYLNKCDFLQTYKIKSSSVMWLEVQVSMDSSKQLYAMLAHKWPRAKFFSGIW